MDWSIYAQCPLPGKFEDFVIDKEKSARSIFIYMLSRLQKMFEYKGLPETVPKDVLERYLLINGIACFTQVDGSLYIFNGNLGGYQDAYYRPTKFIVSNPHLGKAGFFKEVTVFGNSEHDGVLLRNDTEWCGLVPLISKYAYLMAENFLTIRSADIMLRLVALITAPNDSTKTAADTFISDLKDGKLSAIAENRFFDGVKMQSPPSNNGSYLTQFIELHQYLLGCLYNEIGLKANYNMKREAIGTGESTMDDDVILPLCENMLMCRREDFKKVNEMFGTNISVDFSSVWKSKHLLSSIEIIQEASQLSSPDVVAEAQNDSDLGQNDADMDQIETEMSQNETVQETDEVTDNALQDVIEELDEDIAEFISEKEVEDEAKEEITDSQGEDSET